MSGFTRAPGTQAEPNRTERTRGSWRNAGGSWEEKRGRGWLRTRPSPGPAPLLYLSATKDQLESWEEGAKRLLAVSLKAEIKPAASRSGEEGRGGGDGGRSWGRWAKTPSRGASVGRQPCLRRRPKDSEGRPGARRERTLQLGQGRTDQGGTETTRDATTAVPRSRAEGVGVGPAPVAGSGAPVAPHRGGGGVGGTDPRAPVRRRLRRRSRCHLTARPASSSSARCQSPSLW